MNSEPLGYDVRASDAFSACSRQILVELHPFIIFQFFKFEFIGFEKTKFKFIDFEKTKFKFMKNFQIQIHCVAKALTSILLILKGPMQNLSL